MTKSSHLQLLALLNPVNADARRHVLTCIAGEFNIIEELRLTTKRGTCVIMSGERYAETKQALVEFGALVMGPQHCYGAGFRHYEHTPLQEERVPEVAHFFMAHTTTQMCDEVIV